MNGRYLAHLVLLLATASILRADVLVTNWHRIHPYYKGTPYQHLTFGNGLFVGVASGPQSTRLRTSSDGYSWTNHPLPTTNVHHLNFAEGRFLMSGGQSHMFVSSNGIQWEGSNIGIPVKQFACGDGKCAGLFGYNGIAYSSDGSAWNVVSSDTGNVSLSLYGIAYGAGTFVAVGEGQQLLYSTNGTVWTNVNLGLPPGRLTAVTYACNKFTVIGLVLGEPQPRFFQSSDGRNWTAFSPTPPQSSLTCPAILGGWTTRDGSDWSNDFTFERHPQYSHSLPATAFGNGRFVKVGGYGNIGGELVLASTNGLAWENRGIVTLKDLLSITVASNNMLVAVGAAGAIVTSTNGWRWQQLEPSITTNTLRGVTFANGQFLAVGDAGTVIVSTNGWNWVVQPFPATNDLAAVAFAERTFTVVGSSGFIATKSSDVWQIQSSGTVSNLAAITYGNGRWVAVGVAHILTSTNATDWTITHQIPLGYGLFPTCWKPLMLRGVTYGAGRFVTVGFLPPLPINPICGPTGQPRYSYNTILTSTNGLNWQFYLGAQSIEGTSVLFDGQLFIQGASNSVCNPVLTSSNGTNFAAVSVGSQCFIPSALAAYRSYLIAVGPGGQIFRTGSSISFGSPQFLGAAGFMFEFKATRSDHYRIEYADTFGQWQLLDSISASNALIIDNSAVNSPSRIYRALAP